MKNALLHRRACWWASVLYPRALHNLYWVLCTLHKTASLICHPHAALLVVYDPCPLLRHINSQGGVKTKEPKRILRDGKLKLRICDQRRQHSVFDIAGNPQSCGNAEIEHICEAFQMSATSSIGYHENGSPMLIFPIARPLLSLPL
jgi:hypothetical protein